ncbi:MAG TPA: ABC transporter permease [Cyclobacteriaceae bacterium]|nr:ABC transporter permease [Cyclobacteriaceae bacterium]
MTKMKDTGRRNGPPSWAVRFFRWYCNDHLFEAVSGDMEELYQRRKKKLGERRADFLFLWNVLSFIQPFAFRKSTYINNIAMLENYLKISWRTMTRQKMYTAIKVGGFAVGLATCILIFLFIRNEMDYDQQYVGKNVYRIYNEWRGPDGGKWTSFPANIHSILKNDYPEVEKSARLIPFKWFNAGSNLMRRDDRVENTYEEGFAYADNDLLDILDIPMVLGNRENALTKPMSIVLSKKMADKYFPHEDPVGKIIILNEEKAKPFFVGGVMKDFPANSHLHYEFFITLANVEFWPGEQTSWCCWNYNAYVRLRPNTDVAAFSKKLTSMKDTYLLTHLEKQGDQSLADVKKYHFFGAQPVQDIYLKSDGIGDEEQHGDLRYIWLFGGIACFILLLACINFVNLATARSANRAKEVGLRKVVGSFRGYLVRQFLTESLLYSFVSFSLALVIVVLSLPFFNQLAGKQLSLPWTLWWFLPSLVGVAFVVGMLAGIYPAFYLSAFKPVDVLKGSASRGSKSSTLRSAMVVFQFTTSIILIIGTIVIYQQMNFILHTKIGFDKERIIMVQGANTLEKKHDSFKNELKQLAGVENVTANNYLPVAGTHRDQNGFWKKGREKLDKGVYGQAWYVDEDYISTLGMKLVSGRNFDEKLRSDTASIIINQKMAKEFGFTKPLGEQIGNWRSYTVIGVVEDFHFESMKGEIRPLCLKLGDGGEIVSVKVKSGNIPEVLASVQKVWNKFMPNQPFRYTFMDQSYARMYEDVDRTGKIFASFAGLAIFVACLGLFALSAFMVEQRGKEISIRLVMGASVRNIFRLLTQNFVSLVIVSFVLAAPLAWYLMSTWLQDYKYKIELSWDMFALAGAVSVLIAVTTISYQTISAALAKPADRLRSE